MGFFECCHYCVPPKRHQGCHSNCPEYKEQRRLWDEHKESIKQAEREEKELQKFFAQKAARRRRNPKY